MRSISMENLNDYNSVQESFVLLLLKQLGEW
ncbi:hypothetical protein T09_10172 [Trichinella sp. T9]|nr:hypothetical protein T09_10172 [Trichinella sp. T9]